MKESSSTDKRLTLQPFVINMTFKCTTLPVLAPIPKRVGTPSMCECMEDNNTFTVIPRTFQYRSSSESEEQLGRVTPTINEADT
jgi:hypothetical protein